MSAVTVPSPITIALTDDYLTYSPRIASDWRCNNFRRRFLLAQLFHSFVGAGWPSLLPSGTQRRDPHSILNWTRRMLAVRSSHPAFGRGTLTLLSPKNRKVLAYLREYEGDTLLCVANLGHSPEPVELDLSQFADRVPVELNAGSLFPPIGELTYLLTLPPFGFYWFALAAANDPPSWHTPAPEPLPEFVTMIVRDSLAKALASPAAKLVEDEALPQYIAKRRWFGLKDQTIKAVRVTHLVNIGDEPAKFCSPWPRSRQLERRPVGFCHWRFFGRTNRLQRSPICSLWRACGVAGARVCSPTPLLCHPSPIDLLRA
jgi:hypothetical protein